MSSIMKVRNKWRCQIRRKGHPGLSKMFALRADAAAWGKLAEDELLKGRPAQELLGYRTICEAERRRPTKSPMRPLPTAPDCGETCTVGDLIRRYLNDVSPHKLSGKGDPARMRPMLKNFEHLPITALTSGALSEYKAARLRIASASTVGHELSILHRAYVLAQEEWGIAFSGPIPRTRRPKQPKGRARRVRDRELDQILAATESTELRVIARFAVATAMRRGEIMSLRWENIDLNKRTALLPTTKNGHSRTVPLSPWAVDLLRSTGPDSGGPVFTLKPNSVSQMFGHAAKRARAPDIRFHDLRHEATSRLFERGLNQIEVSRITGHLTLSMLDRYTHLDISHLVWKLAGTEVQKPHHKTPKPPTRGGKRTQSRRGRRARAGLWKRMRDSDDNPVK